ncbi:MAG: fibronectin type III domain-containing protein [Spirochaetes bacterium]|nr:fibronectin type III domain-containing protein [Spirochaetota bacterium]
MKHRSAMTAALLLLTATLAFGQTQIYKDESGKIEIGFFTGMSATENHPSLTITPGGDWVVVNGGGGTDWMSHWGAGSLLYASYPTLDLKSWTIKAKDHLTGDRCSIQGYALAMRIQGMTREQLRANMYVGKVSGAIASQSLAKASVEDGYVMIGGGFNIAWTGTGNMVQWTAPAGPTTWIAQSKDHKVADPAVITCYVIGIKQNLPGIGTIETETRYYDNHQQPYPKAVIEVSPGYVLVGGGAFVGNNSPMGKLLWINKPTLSAYGSWEARAMDPSQSETNAWIRVYAIGAKVKPPVVSAAPPKNPSGQAIQAGTPVPLAPSGPQTGTTLPAAGAPRAPSGLSIDQVTSSSARLSWKDNSGDETKFRIERSAQKDTGYTAFIEVHADVTACAATGLAAGTRHWFRIMAMRGSVSSGYSTAAYVDTPAVVTGAPPKPATPAAPSDLRVTAVAVMSVTIAWTDNSSDETGFEIWTSLQKDRGFGKAGSAGANAREHTLSPLITGKQYFIKVRAVNGQVASDYSRTVPAMPVRSEATLKVVNDSKYAIVDLALNGQQKLTQATAIPVGQSRDFIVTPAGTVSYVLGAGMYDAANAKIVPFQKTGSASLTSGQTTTVTYANPAIAEVLGNFGSQATWTGTVAGVKVRFVFSSSGTWKYYNSMTATTPTSSGNVTLVSWGNSATSCVFNLNSTWKKVRLTFKPASFDLPLEFNNTVLKFTLAP